MTKLAFFMSWPSALGKLAPSCFTQCWTNSSGSTQQHELQNCQVQR